MLHMAYIRKPVQWKVSKAGYIESKTLTMKTKNKTANYVNE